MHVCVRHHRETVHGSRVKKILVRIIILFVCFLPARGCTQIQTFDYVSLKKNKKQTGSSTGEKCDTGTTTAGGGGGSGDQFGGGRGTGSTTTDGRTLKADVARDSGSSSCSGVARSQSGGDGDSGEPEKDEGDDDGPSTSMATVDDACAGADGRKGNTRVLRSDGQKASVETGTSRSGVSANSKKGKKGRRS